MVGTSIPQKCSSWFLPVLSNARTNIGFIFKIRYNSNCLSLSTGLADKNTVAMVSNSSRIKQPFRDGNWAADTVWKVRAWVKHVAKRVTDLYSHQHAVTVLQTTNKTIAAMNEETCLAGRA